MHRKRLKPLVATVILLGTVVFLLSPVFGRVVFNTIDPTAIVSGNGRQIVVSGPISITAGEKSDLRVTITQRSTGAVAEGSARLVGTGNLEHWELTAEAIGDETFDPGPATAVAIARSTERGAATDAHQWLVNITLVAK